VIGSVLTRERTDSIRPAEPLSFTTVAPFLRAVRGNAAHGLPLSRADREAAVIRIIRADASLSDRAVAAVVGLSQPTVGAIRRRSTDKSFQSNTRTGQDGRSRPLDASEGRRRASRIIAEHPDAALRTVARDAKISLGTAHDVRKRMERGEDPVPVGRPRQRVGARVPPRRPADGTPGQSALHILRHDPSLRLSETGRALLQWLGVYAIDDSRDDMVDAIPEHCLGIVVELARSCAENWARLGEDLERRHQGSVASLVPEVQVTEEDERADS
jgi:hypothetical protein